MPHQRNLEMLVHLTNGLLDKIGQKGLIHIQVEPLSMNARCPEHPVEVTLNLGCPLRDIHRADKGDGDSKLAGKGFRPLLDVVMTCVTNLHQGGPSSCAA
jgi:hypothetical protein